MRICQAHWDQLREAVQRKGMYHLVAKSGEEATARIKAEISNQPSALDPLMSCNFIIWSLALECGGLYLMGTKPDGTPYCPLCELLAHIPTTQEDKDVCRCEGGFKDIATCWIEGATDAEKEHCISLGLELKPYEFIIVRYSCVCGLKQVECKVTAREPNEDILKWMEGLGSYLSADHNKRSPNCHPKSLQEIMIPVSGADRIGGVNKEEGK